MQHSSLTLFVIGSILWMWTQLPQVRGFPRILVFFPWLPIHMLDLMKIEWLANDLMKVWNCLARLGCINSAFSYVEANSRVYVMWTSKGYGLHWLRSMIFLIYKYTTRTQFLRLSVSLSFHHNVQESHIIIQHHLSCWQLQSTNYWLLADKTPKHGIPQRNTWI